MCSQKEQRSYESVLEGYTEYYSADLSEKVIRGMTDNALKCSLNGSTAMKEVRDTLHAKGGVTNKRGQEQTFHSIQRTLNNRRYMREFRCRDVAIPDGVPAIVPKELFDSMHQSNIIRTRFRLKTGSDFSVPRTRRSARERAKCLENRFTSRSRLLYN